MKTNRRRLMTRDVKIMLVTGTTLSPNRLATNEQNQQPFLILYIYT